MIRFLRPSGLRRDWKPDAIYLDSITAQTPCRVCGGVIEPGPALRRRWNDITVSHVACGWHCVSDRRIVDIELEARSAIEAAKRGAA